MGAQFEASVPEPRADEVTRRLTLMNATEDSYAPPPARVREPGAPASTRQRITHWFCQMGESFDLSGHAVGLACNFLDRVLAHREVSPVEYQLVAVTSLLVAAKLEEAQPLTLDDLVVLASGLFTKDDIRTTELELCNCLEWRLAAPTVPAYVDLLVELLEPEARASIAAGAEPYAQAALVEDALRPFADSTLAVASVLCACRRAQRPVAAVEAWTAQLKRCGFRYSSRDLLDCGVLLLKLGPDGCDPSFSENDEDELRDSGDEEVAALDEEGDAMDESSDDDKDERSAFSCSPDTVLDIALTA